MGALRVLCCTALAFFGIAPLRAEAQSENLFAKLKVDVSVVVYKHATGADMVTITVVAPDYPAAELESRAAKVGAELGVPSRGVKVYTEPNGGSKPFLKVGFATNGILGDAELRIQPLVRAFAGGSGPSLVQGMDIHLEGAKASPTTLSSFQSDSVLVEGRPEPSPPAIEYRVLLKSQDADKIVIPDRMDATPPAQAPQEPTPTRPSTLLIAGLVLLGALAAGALVYNLALRRSVRTPRR